MSEMYQSPESNLVHDVESEAIEEVKNPWLSIFYQPRKTIRYIAYTKAYYGVPILVILNGLFTNWEMLWDSSYMEYGIVGQVAIWFVLGSLYSLIGLFLFAYCMKLMAGLFGGRASFKAGCSALAWSYAVWIPFVPIFIWLIASIGIGEPIDMEDFESLEVLFGLAPGAILLSGAAFIIVIIGSIFLYCHTFAEINGFTSAWKSLLIMLITLIIVMALFVAIVFVVFSYGLAD